MYHFKLIGIDYKEKKYTYTKETSFEKIYQLVESEYCLSRDNFILSYKKPIKPCYNVFDTIIPGCIVKMYSLFDEIRIDKLHFGKNDYLECIREMLDISDYFKFYYSNIDLLNNNKNLNIPIKSVFDKSVIRKLKGKSNFKNGFIIYKKIYHKNPIEEKKTISKPLSLRFGLNKVISNSLINYLIELDIEDIKYMIIFFDVLGIDYYKNLVIAFMAHYIYRKKSVSDLIDFKII